jgi:hypothetical protein
MGGAAKPVNDANGLCAAMVNMRNLRELDASDKSKVLNAAK